MDRAQRTLEGRRVLVTRPSGQAGSLCGMIEARGGQAWRFPTLEILPLEDAGELEAVADRLGGFDIAIFISANAVAHALDVILARVAWPPATLVAAIGAATAAALERRGIAPGLRGSGDMTSETLLEHPRLRELAGTRVVIFRGNPGREVLGRTLASRGATVEYVQAYRRCRPRADSAALDAALLGGEIDVVTVSSGEGLENLVAMVSGAARPRLLALPLVVPGARVAREARRLGFAHPPVVARNAGDAGILEAILGVHGGD